MYIYLLYLIKVEFLKNSPKRILGSDGFREFCEFLRNNNPAQFFLENRKLCNTVQSTLSPALAWYYNISREKHCKKKNLEGTIPNWTQSSTQYQKPNQVIQKQIIHPMIKWVFLDFTVALTFCKQCNSPCNGKTYEHHNRYIKTFYKMHHLLETLS